MEATYVPGQNELVDNYLRAVGARQNIDNLPRQASSVRTVKEIVADAVQRERERIADFLEAYHAKWYSGDCDPDYEPGLAHLIDRIRANDLELR